MSRSRFASLRRAVETGTYQADPVRIADAIISRAVAASSIDDRGARRPTLTAASMNVVPVRWTPGKG